MDSERALREMADEVLQGKIKTVGDLQRRKIEFSKKHKLSRVLKNSEILSILKQKRVPSLLLKKPVRTLSGVTVVSVMSRPHPCPHGRCTFCPGGGDVPQSYTGFEPATRRGIQHDFDAFSQIVARLSQLEAIGHPTDKCELIVMGGTFLSQKGEYQREFVKRCFDALNERESNSLRKAQSLNERARHRCVGLTFETRPDWCRESHISKMLNFGGTRVELGVQTIYDDVYERVKREHLVEDVIKATELLKDSGLKVCYHMMPGLPGSDFERDFKAFKTIFSQEKFKPDMIKFYPCLVLKGTELYEDWKKGEFVPLNTKKALELLIEVKKLMPRWVRTMRITRDIPSNLIEAGVKKTNLGQMLYLEMKRRKISCKCIRCREVGHVKFKEPPNPEDVKLLRKTYKASGGEEIFLSFEDLKNQMIIGFLRLRIPKNPFRWEMGENTALVRELHIYGYSLPIGREPLKEWQHRGYGGKLLREAERISREDYDSREILVLSGIGAREYYRRFSYKLEGVYMRKELS